MALAKVLSGSGFKINESQGQLSLPASRPERGMSMIENNFFFLTTDSEACIFYPAKQLSCSTAQS